MFDLSLFVGVPGGSAAKAIRGASSILEQTGKEKRRGWGGRKGNKGGKGDTDSCGPSLRCRRGAGARASRESAPTGEMTDLVHI